MRKIATFLYLLCAFQCLGQKNASKQFTQDTLHISPVPSKQVAVLQLSDAFVVINFSYFFEKLSQERTGCAKQIKSRQRLVHNTSQGEVIQQQLTAYQKQYRTLDTVYQRIRAQKSNSDTMWIDYDVFRKVGSRFGDFLPSLIEANKCAVLDKNMKFQPFLIRQKSRQKTDSMHIAGSTLYFIPGHEQHFWSKWDYSS